jgi:NAD+ synthase (glutamine-hydrolysing)
VKIACYQFNPIVGDIEGNINSIISAVRFAKSSGANILLLPELSFTGYAMQDMILRIQFQTLIKQHLNKLLGIQDITIIVSLPFQENGKLFNSILIIENGKIISRYDKFSLPNYGVFDEKRYFSQGYKIPISLYFNNLQEEKIKYSFLICEDIWIDSTHRNEILKNNDVILIVNASPFTINKYYSRIKLISSLAKKYNTNIIYLNQVGAEDGLVFDGASFAINCNGNIVYQAPAFEQSLDIIKINKQNNEIIINSDVFYEYPQKLESVYKALVLGLSDYCKKNNFKSVILGLSGGIDSALALLIAVDALGIDHVYSYMLHTKYNSPDSLSTAKKLANNLKVFHKQINIMPILESMLTSIGYNSLNDAEIAAHSNYKIDLSLQNLQARIRGNILMTFANQLSGLVINTSNKSEIALGYGTLYGDLAGGYAVLKDVYKTLVYDLIKFRDPHNIIVPNHIINRPPSAELKNNQQDDDTLPPYNLLDQILELLVEKQMAVNDIIDLGFESDMVHYVAKTLFANEYKRSQLAVGTKISDMAFNIDWRYPITKKVDLIS